MRAMRYEVFAWADRRPAVDRRRRPSAAPAGDGIAGVRGVGAGRVRHVAVALAAPGATRSRPGADAVRAGRAGAGERPVTRRASSRPGMRRDRPPSRARRGVRQQLTARPCVLHVARWRPARSARYDEADRFAPGPAQAGPADGQSRPTWRRPRWRTGSPPTTTPGPRWRRSPRPTASPARPANRWMSAFARTEASGLLVHRGELAAGCDGLAEMVDTLVPGRRVVAAVAHPGRVA